MTADEYDEIYRDASKPPWDIGRPQPALARVLDDKVNGPKVLDIGCGTGELSLALARRGYDVTGVDISRVAIDIARAKATAEGLAVNFEVQDATNLSLPSAPFDSLFDCGLLHSLDRRSRADVDAYISGSPDVSVGG